jgi:tetratricopeptide (TPR) repeat protein
MTGVLIAALVIALPFAMFVAWPLFRTRGAPVLLPLPPDPREPLLERRSAALRALRELDFEHESGHVSDDDYVELRARYEAETAEVLLELDRLGAAAPARTERPRRELEASPARVSAWRHPLVLGGAAMALVVFGVVLGVGIVRYTEPDRMAGEPMPGSRPLASLETPAAPAGAVPGGAPVAGGKPLAPEMLRGMLSAARQSLFAGRPQEASAAYQAVLKRDPENVDALTHLGLLLVMSADGERRNELIDHGLQLFDRALKIEPAYAPAYFYRGQVLYEVKGDRDGAVAAWQKFVEVSPPGEDRDRVAKMIADAKSAPPAPAAKR